MSKKRDFSLVVWAFGWLLNLATLIKKHVDKLGVPFEAFAWLVSDRGESTLEKTIKLIKAEYETELNKLMGNVLYGFTVEEVRSEYSQKSGYRPIFDCLREGTLIDKIEGLPKTDLYQLEFELLVDETDSIDVIRERLANEGKRFATLNEGLQFMIDGQNGSKVTNWEHVFTLGTVLEISGEGREEHYCYVHNNMDGMDYGSKPALNFSPSNNLLVVKSSTFIRSYTRAA